MYVVSIKKKQKRVNVFTVTADESGQNLIKARIFQKRKLGPPLKMAFQFDTEYSALMNHRGHCFSYGMVIKFVLRFNKSSAAQLINLQDIRKVHVESHLSLLLLDSFFSS